MLIRIVRMHFREEETATFLEIFMANKEAIRNFPGCTHLELLKDAHAENTYVTLSHWNGPDDLEAYRKSALFGTVWKPVKKLFATRAEAFTFEKFVEVG